MSLDDADVLPPSPSDSHVEADLDLRKATLVRLLYLRQGGLGPSPLGDKAPPKTSLHHHHHHHHHQPLVCNNTISIEVDTEQQLEFSDSLQTHIEHPVVGVHTNTTGNIDDSNDIIPDSSGSGSRHRSSSSSSSSSRQNGNGTSRKQRQAAHLFGTPSSSRFKRPP